MIILKKKLTAIIVENWKFTVFQKYLIISIHVYEINNTYRLLYKYENIENSFGHICIINHKMLKSGAPHYELLTIN